MPSGVVVRNNLVIEFFFNDAATTEIYTLALHDALPIYGGRGGPAEVAGFHMDRERPGSSGSTRDQARAAVAADAGGQARGRIPSGSVVRDNLVAEWRSDYALGTGCTGNGAISNGQGDGG